MNGESVSVVVGDEALALAGDAAFRVHWLALYDQTPWATPGQHPDFVRLHWQAFRASGEPVLVIQHDPKSRKILGLLALTRSRGRLHGAGAEDSEYHTWLADVEHAETFMPVALLALRKRLGALPLTLQYLPPGVPLAWASTAIALRDWCHVTSHPRGVMTLGDPESLERYLHGKRNLRKKGNKLRTVGDLQFRHVTRPEDFHNVLGQFIPLYDFRKGAAHRVTAFRHCPMRRMFIESLFETGELLHVTSLELNGRAIAVHLGLAGRHGTFSLGGSAHSEFFAKYSPGSLVIAELARMLVRQGFAHLDMTPGSDPYKSQLSNQTQIVHALTVTPSAALRATQRVQVVATRSCGRLLASLPTNVIDAARRFRQSQRGESDLAAESARVEIHRLPVGASPIPSSLPWRRDEVADLVAFAEEGERLWRFLRSSQRLIHAGARVFTRCAGRKLSAAWFVLPPTVRSNETVNDPLLSTHWLLATAEPLGAAMTPVDLLRAIGEVLPALDPAARECLLYADLHDEASRLKHAGFEPVAALTLSAMLDGDRPLPPQGMNRAA